MDVLGGGWRFMLVRAREGDGLIAAVCVWAGDDDEMRMKRMKRRGSRAGADGERAMDGAAARGLRAGGETTAGDPRGERQLSEGAVRRQSLSRGKRVRTSSLRALERKTLELRSKPPTWILFDSCSLEWKITRRRLDSSAS